MLMSSQTGDPFGQAQLLWCQCGKPTAPNSFGLLQVGSVWAEGRSLPRLGRPSGVQLDTSKSTVELPWFQTARYWPEVRHYIANQEPAVRDLLLGFYSSSMSTADAFRAAVHAA